MKKRIVSLLLAALLFVTLLPAEALAYVGNVNKEGPLCNRTEPVTIKREGVDDGSQLYSMKMKNGKLVFFLAVDGPHIGKSVTNSDRGYTATGDSFRKGVYEQARFTADSWLFFGKETAGLPLAFRERFRDRCIRLPMVSEARSLNLSNTVAVCVYEALRQTGFPGLQDTGEMAEI